MIRTAQREYEDGCGLHSKDDARMARRGRLHFCAYNVRAYQHYVKLRGAHDPEKKKEMTLHTNFSCHKHPVCSMYCWYYMCEHLRVQGRYTTDPERDNPPRNIGQLHGRELLEVVADLCSFIMHEVVNPRGTFYSKDHELATDPKYHGLREWENKKHRASSSSVGK